MFSCYVPLRPWRICLHAGDPGPITWPGRSSGGGTGSPLQYSCLENPMHRGAWRTTVHGITRVRHDLVPKPPPNSLFYHKIGGTRCSLVWEELSGEGGIWFSPFRFTYTLSLFLIFDFEIISDFQKSNKNNKKNYHQRGCGEKGTLLHCWWECKLTQPLWRTVRRFL